MRIPIALLLACGVARADDSSQYLNRKFHQCIPDYFQNDSKLDEKLIACLTETIEYAKSFANAARTPEDLAAIENTKTQALYYRGMVHARHKTALDERLDPAPVIGKNDSPRGAPAALKDLNEAAASPAYQSWEARDHELLDQTVLKLRKRLALQDLNTAYYYSRYSDEGFFKDNRVAKSRWMNVYFRVERFFKTSGELASDSDIAGVLADIASKAGKHAKTCPAGDSVCRDNEDARADLLEMIAQRASRSDLKELRKALQHSRGEDKIAAVRFQLSMDKWTMVKDRVRQVLSASGESIDDPRSAAIYKEILSAAEAGARTCASADERCQADEEARLQLIEGLSHLPINK